MQDLIIIGAGGFGRETAWLVERINQREETWHIAGFLDDTRPVGSLVGGYPVIGGVSTAVHDPNVWYVCAVGSPKARAYIIRRRLAKMRVQWATLIDPSVLISPRVRVGEGSILCAQTILTVDISLGRHVILNLDCTVGHDAVIGDFCTLYPGVHVSGNVVIGARTEVGTGTQIIQQKRICDDTVIGAGAVVVRDIALPGVYGGVPARNLHSGPHTDLRGRLAPEWEGDRRDV